MDNVQIEKQIDTTELLYDFYLPFLVVFKNNFNLLWRRWAGGMIFLSTRLDRITLYLTEKLQYKLLLNASNFNSIDSIIITKFFKLDLF